MSFLLKLMTFLCVVLSFQGYSNPQMGFEARYSEDSLGRRVLLDEQAIRVKSIELVETSFPRFIAEHQKISDEKIVVLRSGSKAQIDSVLMSRAVDTRPALLASESEADNQDEVVTLVHSGPSENRVDVVFMGDGYTIEERDLFFSDMRRMVDDMFREQTFRSYLPLFNVHVVFRASNESGIGKNGKAKDTAYELARSGDTLRAIFPGNTYAARSSCKKAPGCDYPVIIANDPYYGGLGGEYAISTSSVTSGTKVLRHELGHNFGRVGEEYDGGRYFGKNHATRLRNITWKHWLTEPGKVKAEPSKLLLVDWPWHNLSKGKLSLPFRGTGDSVSASLKISASGLDTDGSLDIKIDGESLEFSGPGTKDRMFHEYDFSTAFSKGRHEISFESVVKDGDNWVSSVAIQEYGPGYHFDRSFIGAYPMYNAGGKVDGYRPNHQTCLMRDMNSKVFGVVCQENNWMEFFDIVELIDSLKFERSAGKVTVSLSTLKIGQYYSNSRDDSHISIHWYKDGKEVESLRGLDSWSMESDLVKGKWLVKTQFSSPEIRKDFSKFYDSASIEID
ncbi:M64 family metallopeptidase [bacterium]|nr:M64 family metallopeptidase [bacterium]